MGKNDRSEFSILSDAPILIESLYITRERAMELEKLLQGLMRNNPSIAQVMKNIWIDKSLSGAEVAYLIFWLGYQTNNLHRKLEMMRNEDCRCNTIAGTG